MSTTLAPNKQAERSLDEQSIVVPADIRQSAIQSPAVLALCRLEGNSTGTKSLRFWFALRHLDEIIDKLFEEEVTFLRTAFENIAPIYSGTAPTAPEPLSLGV